MEDRHPLSRHMTFAAETIYWKFNLLCGASIHNLPAAYFSTSITLVHAYEEIWWQNEKDHYAQCHAEKAQQNQR